MSAAEKAFLGAGVGILALAVPGARVQAATTVHFSTMGSVLLDLDSNTANGAEIRIFASGSSTTAQWWLAVYNSVSAATLTTGLPRPWLTASSPTSAPFLSGSGVKRFIGFGQIPSWGTWLSPWGTWASALVWDPTGGTNWTGYWDSGSGYIGYRLARDWGYYYGWIELAAEDGGATLIVWPASTAGTSEGGASPTQSPAATGTPEPAASSLALLALGAAGVIRHRRRREASVA